MGEGRGGGEATARRTPPPEKPGGITPTKPSPIEGEGFQLQSPLDYEDDGHSPLNILCAPSSGCDGFEPRFVGLRRHGAEEGVGPVLE